MDKLDKIFNKVFKDSIFANHKPRTLKLYLGMLKPLIIKWAENSAVIDRDIFRTVVSEHPPTICEDSQQPEWCQGELDKCLDELMAEKPIRIR